MIEQEMKKQQQGKDWGSQDDTLLSAGGTDRSRWSWLSWHGPMKTRDKEAEVDVFGKELERVQEEGKADVEMLADEPKRDAVPGTAI